MSYRFPTSKIWFARCLEYLLLLVAKTLGWMRREPLDTDDSESSVLLVEPYQLGDVASLFVLLPDIQRQVPGCKVLVFTQEKNRELLELDPRIAEVITAPVPWAGYESKRGRWDQWRQLWTTLRELRARSIDVGLDLRGEIRNHALLVLAGCRRRVGYTSYMGSNMVVQGHLLTDNLGPLPIEHRYQLNRRVLAGWLPEPLQPIQLPSLHLPSSDVLERTSDRPLVVVHTGGGWRYKRWHRDRWKELLGKLGADLDLVLVGSAGEAKALSDLSRDLGSVPHQVQITGMEELVRVLAGADLFVGLDSGPMNLAVAVGTPVVALFGPGDSELWYPFGSSDRFLHAKKDLTCNPCFQTSCVIPEQSCMSRISVENVEHAVRSVLAKPSLPA